MTGSNGSNTREEKMALVDKIVRHYITHVGGKQFAIRPFVEVLNEPMKQQGFNGFSHQVIHNWMNRSNLPGEKIMLLQHCAEKDTDSWQYKFACDILKATG